MQCRFLRYLEFQPPLLKDTFSLDVEFGLRSVGLLLLNHVKRLDPSEELAWSSLFCCLWIRTVLVYRCLFKGIPTGDVALRVLYHCSWLEAAEGAMWITVQMGLFLLTVCGGGFFFPAFCICFSVMVVFSLRVDSLWVHLNSYQFTFNLPQIKTMLLQDCFTVFMVKLLWCSFWWMISKWS